MYRELINEFAQNNKHVAAQEPALPAEIDRAEAAVGYPFPEELRELLSEMNGDHYFLLSTDEIMEVVSVNREYLLECYEDIGQHIFFAGNGCGDYYCYNVDSDGCVDSGKIYIWLHEINETRLVASSIPELIRRYYNDEI